MKEVEIMDLVNRVIELSNKYEKQVIQIRRQIHQNPELAFKEYKTSKLVIDELSKLGIEMHTNIAETGVLGVIHGKEKGKVLLIRADMDALPINESIDIEFKSGTENVMHACGHDVHTANLIGVAKIFNDLKNDFNGTVKLLFQPGEERGGGAKKMIKEGVLKDPKVDHALALHIMPIKKGQILIKNGVVTAASDGFEIKVFGKSAHTSKPEEGIDAINIGSHVVVAMNSIISKNIDPFQVATFSVGKIKGGTANNVVADYAQINGMVRSLSSEARATIIRRIEELAIGIGKSFGGRAEFILRPGYPSVLNDNNLTSKVIQNFKKNYISIIKDIDENIYKEDLNEYIIRDSKALMNAEDFGFIASQVPSTYYMVGTGDYGPQHSPDFYVDEKYIKLCTRTMVLAALEILKD